MSRRELLQERNASRPMLFVLLKAGVHAVGLQKSQISMYSIWEVLVVTTCHGRFNLRILL